MAASSNSSWSLINASETSFKSRSSTHSPEPSSFLNTKTVKIYNGPNHQYLTINEDLFHKFISGFEEDFQQRDLYGQEKSISLPVGDPKDVEDLVKWMEGREGIFNDQYAYEGQGYKLHDLTCFRMFRLAANMGIDELMAESLDNLRRCMNKYPVTVEAVVAAFRSNDPRLNALKTRLVCGHVEEFFTGGRVGRGSLWNRTIQVNDNFEVEVSAAIGHHMVRTVQECRLQKCYIHHKNQDALRGSSSTVGSWV